MTNDLIVFETEEGDPITINGVQADGNTPSCLAWVVEGDSGIEIKTRADVTALKLVGTTDFTFADPTVTWTPTTAQIGMLTKGVKYNGYFYARNDATPRERVLFFTVRVRNS